MDFILQQCYSKTLSPNQNRIGGIMVSEFAGVQ